MNMVFSGEGIRCKCGCGQIVEPGKIWIRNHHPQNVAQKGDKYIRKDGRITVHCPDHPRAQYNKIYEHVLVVEKAMGKFLDGKHPIHHVSLNKSNNENSNLVVCENDAYHKLLHQRAAAFKACGHADYRKCRHCQVYDSLSNITISGTGAYHKVCNNNRRRELYRIRRLNAS